jgi:hypothetical protein
MEFFSSQNLLAADHRYPLAAHASYQIDKTWTPTFLTAFCSMVNSIDSTTNGAITLRLFIAFREYTRRNVKNYIIINVSLIITIIIIIIKQIFIIGLRFINYGSALLSLKFCKGTVCIINVVCTVILLD